MLEFIQNYSGIVAIIVYSFILFLILKFRKPEKVEDEQQEEEPSVEPERLSPLDTADEDAVVASLIASIEAHNETKKNVRVVSVREVG